MSENRKQPIFDVGPANIWYCDQCRAHGPSKLDPQESLHDAVDKIRAAHKLKSPDCIGGTTFIRLIDLEQLKTKGLVA
jgi:hypothetical protein